MTPHKPEAERLAERIEKTPAYSPSKLGADSIYRCDDPTTSSSSVKVILVNASSRDLIAAAIRSQQAIADVLSSQLAGLELLLAAVHSDDPKREILVRIGDAIREAEAALSRLNGGEK